MMTAKPGKRARCSPAADGNLIREPALCLRPGGVIRMFTRTCPGATGWGDGVRSLVSYTAESRDGGVTWTAPEPTTILNNESKIDVLSWDDDDTILMAYNNTPVADWHERSPSPSPARTTRAAPGITFSTWPPHRQQASPPCARVRTGGFT